LKKPLNFRYSKHAAIAAVVLLFASAEAVLGQIKWLEDASTANLPDSAVTGQMKGTGFSVKYGDIRKTGGLNFGSANEGFDHYTLRLGSGESMLSSKFSVDVRVSIRKGERPYGRSFKTLLKAPKTGLPMPGWGVDEVTSLSMTNWPQGVGMMDSLSSGLEMPFAGRLILGELKDNMIAASLYFCFHDKLKSCVAGKIQVEAR